MATELTARFYFNQSPPPPDVLFDRMIDALTTCSGVGGVWNGFKVKMGDRRNVLATLADGSVAADVRRCAEGRRIPLYKSRCGPRCAAGVFPPDRSRRAGWWHGSKAMASTMPSGIGRINVWAVWALSRSRSADPTVRSIRYENETRRRPTASMSWSARIWRAGGDLLSGNE
jgi:hypothetical protein